MAKRGAMVPIVQGRAGRSAVCCTRSCVPSADRLRAIVDVKRELGGRVVQDTGEPLTPARELFPGTSGITNEKVNAEPVQGRLEARRAR